MTNIKQILDMPIGQRLGGFVLTIKTAKKTWQINDVWYHQVLVMDETGEMWADFKIGTYKPLHRGSAYRVIVAEVQHEEKHGKKLFVDQFAPIVDIGEPSEPFYQGESERVVRSKIKCLLVAAYIQAGARIDETEINGLVEYIIK